MASLFDRMTPAATSGTGGSSLFGAAPAAGAASGGGSSLFGGGAGGNTSTAATGAGGLFGGGGNTSTAATGAGGLFGSKPAATTSGAEGLFGGSMAGASLFGGGNAAATTQQPPAAANSGSSLFGGLGAGAATTNATSSLFGQPNPSANAGNAAQATNGSVFGNDILPSARGGQGALERTTDPNAPPSQPAYFQALLERGKKRQAQDYISPFGELPSLELGLADISRKVKNIGQGGPSAGLQRGADARSHYLLSASGVNTNQALRDIDELANSTIGGRNTVGDLPDYNAFSDVKQGLTTYHVDKFQYLVDNHLKKAQADFDRMIDEQLHDVNWDAHRQRIYEHFGLKKPQNNGAPNGGISKFGRSSARQSRYGGASTMGQSFGLPGMAKSVIGTPGPRGARVSAFADVAEKVPEGMRPAPEDRIQRAKQERYSNKVMDLNVARLRESVYPVLKRFAEVEAEPTGEDTSYLVSAFHALIEITGEDGAKQSFADAGAIRERQYATDYLSDSNTKGHTAIGNRIINGSRKYLERTFYDNVKAAVAKSPREANIGGVPTAVATVKGYVRVRASNKDLGSEMDTLAMLGDDYPWPIVYYMLRSGLIQETIQYLDENSLYFRNSDRNFIRYVRAYAASDERRLPPDLQSSINNEYSQRLRLDPDRARDPYCMASYKIIGRCDLSKRTLEATNPDIGDYMWTQFALAREYSRVDEFAHEAYGLAEVQANFTDIAKRYFGPGSDIANAPTTWFYMQILSGMFEKAVAELYPHNYVSATHFAIALDYYGLLRVSDISNSDDLLSKTTRQEPQLAFGSMVGLYTRDFRTANATAAIDYLCLICLNKDLPGNLGKSQRELCHQAITEVVLETREFASLLGDVRGDGQRIQGEIEVRLRLIDIGNQEDFLKQITLVAARTADEQGRVTDAALLFHLAEDYDKVMQILNEAVSLALTIDLNDRLPPLDPLKPRNMSQEEAAQQQLLPAGLQGSLSLTAIDNPFKLAIGLRELYVGNQMYFSKIKSTHLGACDLLLQLAKAREAIQNARWPEAIDSITASRLLPLLAGGDITAIRNLSTTFNDMPAPVARTIGHVMIWALVATSNQIAHLRNLELRTEAVPVVIAQLRQCAADVMVFAGLIRYKLPARMWERLAAIGGR